ncbi:CSN-associated deubiquitinating enzyme Ubp12 [Linnemannia elongata]|nr:CSN-associated deubiquitinating enzyme Ubp12 [Linnemannia elongata]
MGGLGGGFYATYVKNEKTGDWYNFDHSHVSIIGNVESIKSSRAYLFFYHCRNATVREYEQKAHLSVTPVRNFKIQERDDDDDGEYGLWGRPPIGPFQDDNDHDNMMSGLDDSDNELPSYSSAIGRSGLASPQGSY